MNKKAALFMPTLAIATLFLLTYSFYVFIIKDPGTHYYSSIGDNQVSLSNTYSNVEKDLLYTEQVVKYSLNKATEKFLEHGGIKEECIKTWVFNDPTCNPALEENFKMYLQAFKYGMPPEGGFSFGLERITMQILDLKNIREASLFPRDMERIDFRLNQ